MSRATKLDGIWFLACALASSCWCVSTSWELGATYDEPFYVTQGLNFWRSGSHRELLRLGTMPLPVDLATLPLYLWERCTHSTINASADLAEVLPWARLPNLLFWWLTLLYGGLIGTRLAGSWGGRTSVALLASEPNLLAHACLATTDVAVTGCLLAFAYHFQSAREGGWRQRLLIPACWFGLTVLAKASGLVYGILCMMVVTLHAAHAAPRGSWPRMVRQLFWDATHIVLLGLVVVFVYCGSDWRSEPGFVAWAHSLPEGAGHDTAVWCAENLRIFSNAGVALVRQIRHNVQGHGVFIAGVVHQRALWYYFPLLLCIKLPLSILAAPLILLLVKPRALWNWPFFTAVMLLGFSLTFRVQIGVRLILPIVALAIVGVSAAGVQAAQAGLLASAAVHWRQRVQQFGLCSIPALLTAAVLWSALAAVRVWPNALCYTNEFWGDTREGYLYVSDGNFDWGQGLNELADWQQEHGAVPLAIWYFGADTQLERLPMKRVHFHAATRGEFQQEVRGRCLAVSTTLLYGAYTSETNEIVKLLRDSPTCGRTQTFLIYDFRLSPP